MPEEIRQVYFLSNGTAITAETLGHSLLAQFPSLQFKTRTIPFIDSVEKALAVNQEIDLEVGDSKGLPIVISTMADPELRKIIHQSKALMLYPPQNQQLLLQFQRISLPPVEEGEMFPIFPHG